MAVAHSTVSESHTGAIGSISQASFTWNHAAAANPFGVLVFVHNMSGSTDKVTAVTYGGVALAAVAGGRAVDAATEPGDCQAWFLGDASTIPSGTQSVVVTRTNDTDELYAVCITVVATAGMDTAVHEAGIVLLQGDGTLAEQSVTDGSPGANSVRYASGFSGLAAFPPTGASSTDLSNFDTGNQTVATVRETTAGQGARNVGFASGTSDDRAFVHLAVKEITASDPQLVTPGTASLITTPFAPTVTATAHVVVTPGLANPGSGYQDAVLADSPAGYWRMDEASGQPQDASGNANHTTFSVGTPTYAVTGALGDNTAIRFLGAEGFRAPDHATLDLGDVLTLEAWVKRDTLSTLQTIFSKGSNTYQLAFLADNTFCLAKDGVAVVVASTGTVTDALYHHIVATKNGATSKLYLDGQDVTGAVTNQTMVDGAAVLYIGVGLDGSQNFDGDLDELAVYPTALSATRILAHFNARSLTLTAFAPTVTVGAPAVIVAPGLANPGLGYSAAVLADSPVAYYRLGEASGTNANDDTANANDGTYTNTPTLGVAGAMTDDTAVTLASASSEYVTAPNTTANNIIDATFSLEAWIRASATPAGFAHLLSKADSGVAVGYCLRTNGDGLALVAEVNIGGTNVSAAYAGGGVWNGVWHHVVVRYDGANLSIWFDGVMAGNPAATANVTDSSAKPLNIGASGDASNFFAGSIDEVALYATALSATRILAHYNARSLTLTTFAPTVTVESAAITVIMGTASVALSTFAPTVLTPVLVTPATAALTIATMIPSVTFGIRVTMGLAALATSTFTPSVTVSDHILATVGAASMTITAFAPSSLTPQVITMTNASIVTATFAPSVLLPIVVTMNVASLSTSTFAPSVTVGAGVVATLFTASIVTASFAPTIVNPQSATMGRATLTLATFVPSANITVLVTMNTATLTTASFVPTVSTPQTITIDKLTMTTATFVPTVSTPQLVTMTTASLITTPFVPAVTASNNVLVSMNPASMVITTYTMTVYTGGGTFGEAVAVVVRRQPNVAGASQSGEITATVIRRVN